MEFKLEANINVLWQNLIALNASLMRENEEQRAELVQTKELLKKEMENSKILRENNTVQLQKLATLCSKMVAVRQIVSHERDDDHSPFTVVTATNLPVIVKVESVDSDPIATEDANTSSAPLPPVNVCNECDRKFCSISSLKRHRMAIHSMPKYSCPRCTQTFSRRAYLSHIKHAHKNDEDISTRCTRANTTF